MLLVNDVNTYLRPFFETGTEGIYWSICIDNQGYDGLYVLHDGDELTVHTKDRSAILWNGIVHLEYERLLTPYPTNPEYRQQMIFNRWVHGFQVGLQPDVWAQWFLDELPASLIRND